MKGCDICSKKCFGIDGYDGSCCTVEDRDYIIGPHSDAEEFLQKLSDKFGRSFEFDEVFYDYLKGKEVFTDKTNWQKPGSYPALRVDLTNKRKPCIFYNTSIKACSIYDIRPQTCRTYKCQYLEENAEDI